MQAFSIYGIFADVAVDQTIIGIHQRISDILDAAERELRVEPAIHASTPSLNTLHWSDYLDDPSATPPIGSLDNCCGSCVASCVRIGSELRRQIKVHEKGIRGACLKCEKDGKYEEAFKQCKKHHGNSLKVN